MINQRTYNHLIVEPKWQKRWAEEKTFEVEDFPEHPFYCLVEFPYPSGEGLHVGHPRSYTAMDIVCRKKRMQGLDVLYPIGFDAFGLPAENFAIKKRIHPSITTKKNIARFRTQLRSMGFSFDWSREVNTTDPKYYRWTQWIFLQFYKAGLAYKAKFPINWCPSCKIGLANEEVVGGRCERCGARVELREKEQWLLKITEYAERLLEDLKTVDYLPKIKIQQENWIGKNAGAHLRFGVEGRDESINIFTTRPDTLFGVTYLVLAPEHPMTQILAPEKQGASVAAYLQSVKRESLFDREKIKEKTGVWTGAFAIHPATGEKLPIWVADYVLMNVGTGAVMAVPAHDERDFEFAKKYGLPIKTVIRGGEEEKCFSDHGKIMNSPWFDDLHSQQDLEEILNRIEKKGIGERAIAYKLRDWIFSRQHYWGEPIPMIHCDPCGWVPVPEEQLPVELPYVEKYQPTDSGESPLACMEDWVKVACPKCGKIGRRETDTMPNWAGSSWYFLRYLDPNNDRALADPKKLKHWMPVNIYNGGMEHTTLHLLYSRFWNKFLYDSGAAPTSEPYRHRHSHGMILGQGGEKMSKSRGNVVNPDDLVNEFGADTLRMYLMFLGPFEEAAIWNTRGVLGVRRFLDKVHSFSFHPWAEEGKESEIVDRTLHQTIKKVTEDIDHYRFNTAVSQFMVMMNAFAKHGCLKKSFETFLVLLSPFAPHLCEEVWERLGHHFLICKESWPTFDAASIRAPKITIVIQVNGKVRDRLEVDAGITQEEAESLALVSSKIIKFLPVGKKEFRKVIFVPDKLLNLVV